MSDELPKNQGDGGAPAQGLPEVSTVEMAPHAVTPSQRYRRQEFHARGGLGEVWLTEDSVLGRQVALKTLRRDDEPMRVRFEAEAQITGQLEHPNIVPVHDLGRDGEGRPFYVMKFVRGRTLKSVIAEYHAPAPAAAGGADRQVQWVTLLQIFIDLCHAVAYAHSRGVIHRDLKPDNVMLGSYGETLLLDWGLAKVMNRPGPPGEARGDSGGSQWLRIRSSDSGSATSQGSVIGTPSYMAPEMAGGNAIHTDERTDVYLLGATLYEIITGQLPRRGTSRDEIVELARTIPPPPARKVCGSCPRPLEAVALKAMALRPEDRYQSAMALAADVQRYLANEPVSVCPESFPRRGWRWCKRHRAGIGRAAVAVLLLGLTAAAFLSARAFRDARSRLRAAEDLKDFERHRAMSVYLAANIDSPREHTLYYDPRRGREEVGLALGVVDRWGAALERWPLPDALPQLREETYNLLLLGAQLDNQASQPQQARGLLERAAALQPTLTRGYHRQMSECCALSGDRARADEEARLAEASDGPPDPEDLFLQAEKLRQKTAATTATTARKDLLPAAVQKYQEALRAQPGHYWAHFQLGRCQLARGYPDEAAAELGACIALHPEQPWGYSARGMAFAVGGRFADATRDFDKALEIDPAFLPARRNQGVCYWMQHDLTNARDALNRALNPPQGEGLVEAAYDLGVVDLEQRHFADAVDHLSRLLKQRPHFGAAFARRAVAYLLLKDVERCRADLDSCASAEGADTDSEPKRHAARGKILVGLLEECDPQDAQPIFALATEELALADRASPDVWVDLGRAMLAANDGSRAVTCYDNAVALKPTDAGAWKGLGYANDRLGRHDVAARAFGRAVSSGPADAEAHAYLGYELACVGERERAMSEAAQSLVLAQDNYVAMEIAACAYAELYKARPADAPAQLDLVVAILRRAMYVYHTTFGRNLVQIIKDEPAFRFPALQERDDFQALDPEIRTAAKTFLRSR